MSSQMKLAGEFERGFNFSRTLEVHENELRGEDVLSVASSDLAANALPVEQEMVDENENGQPPKSLQPPCPELLEVMERIPS